MLDKTYQPFELEKHIYDAWEKAGAFSCGQPDRLAAGAKPYCTMLPPPNITGTLHMGHALNHTLQDILIRFERMRGRDVLWQPGTDHAGIATQMVVERQLMESQQPDRRAMGREKFIQRVWEWKAQSGGSIIEQQRRLGESCDWSRQRFTMDDGMSEAVLKVFVELYREGLIYKDKRLVNWDPVFQTAISDLEVETKEVNGHMWQFAYPLVDGAVDGVEEIIIATTRPETMLGDGAVAVHPSDERYKNLIGKMVRLPIAERHIPIIADEYPDPEFGSGAVKITGAHDFNDFEVARRNGIPLIPLMDTQARMIVTPENNVPAHYEGIDRFEARKLVLKEIEALGFYRGVEEKVIAQPFGDRSGAVIEPMLTDQWYADAQTLAKPAIEAVESGKTEFVPKNWEKTYFEWMRNIQPWCISRQLWWGHRIPAWYGPWTGEPFHYHLNDREIFVASSEEEVKKAAEDKFGQEVIFCEDEQEFKNRLEELVLNGGVGQVPIYRDPDVLDTWFSSALWPFSTLGWPEETPELERYYKTDVLVTGFDIIFFWVARMMMMGLHFKKEVPFHTVYIHALVRDEAGAKMSKSKGNVMDPLEMIDEFGADALRFTLAAMAAQGRDIKLAKARVEGYRNFGTKIWNASRFLEMNECVRIENFNPASLNQGVNKWIVGEVEKAAIAVTAGIEAYRFNEAAGALYKFVWNIFCDWYLELIKPSLQGEDESAKAETRATAAWVLDRALSLLHPFMPFITEELWTRLGEQGPKRDTMLILAEWPDLKGLVDVKAEAEFDWVIRVVSEIRSLRSEMNMPAGAKIPVSVLGAGEATRARLEDNRDALMTLARLESIATSDTAPKGAVQFVLDEATFALPLEGVIDIAGETKRLNGEIEKIGKDIAQIEAKLANENFTSRAPEHVVEEQRQRKADAQAVVAKLNDALNRLQAAG